MTYTLKKDEDDKSVTKVVVDATWNVTNKDSFMAVIDDLLKVVDPLLEWFLNGNNIEIFVEELTLKGGVAYSGAIVPLAKALGIDIDDDAATGVAMVDSLINGIFGLVEDIEDAPVSTILTVIGNLAYLVANNGVATVIQNLISPLIGPDENSGLLSLFSSIISREEINNLIKKFVVIDGKGYSLDDIINIAGPKGETLIALLNELLSGLTATSDDGASVPVTNYLADDFFVTLCKYVIEYVTPEITPEVLASLGDKANPTDAEKERIGNITKWTVDKADVLMVILQMVCTEDFLQFIIDVANLESPEDPDAIDPVAIVNGLAGKQNELVDLIIMLLTKYDLKYKKIEQEDITKIAVAQKGNATKEQIASALGTLDDLIPMILGFIPGIEASSLEALIMSFIDKADDADDLANTLLNLIVPLLAGLEDGSVDLAQILDYVAQFSNIDLEIAPAAFAGEKATSKLKGFINDLKAVVDAEHRKDPVKNSKGEYKYTYTKDGETKKYYNESATLTTAEIDGVTYDVTLVTKDHVFGWSDIAAAYTKYVYTKTVDGKEELKYGDTAEETFEGYTLKTDDEGKPVTAVRIDYDFEIDDLDKLVEFATDALRPLDFIFEILLNGENIVIMPDQPHQNAEGKYEYTYIADGDTVTYWGESATMTTVTVGEGEDAKTYDLTLVLDEIRITGGNGFNYAIIPLMEAFGIAVSYTDYNADVADTESHIHYVLDKIVGLVNDLLDAPISTLLEKLANIFYFIGSDGINTIISNLLLPVNALAQQIDDVIPFAVSIDLDKLLADGAEFGDILGLYIGKEHTCPAGVTVDLGARKLAKVINNLIDEIKLNEGQENEIVLNLNLDLDWNKIAAKMAQIADGEEYRTGAALKKTDSAMIYDDTESNAATGPAKHKNIEGEKADTFLALLEAILTDNNKAAIVDLIKGILPEDMKDEQKEIIYEIIENPNAIDNLIIDVILLLNKNGDPVSEYLGFIFKYLGTLAGFTVKEGLDDAIVSLDKVLGQAVPIVLGFIPEDTENPDAIINKLKASDATSLAGLVDDLLDNMVFTDTMMKTITDMIVPILGNLSGNLVDTIKKLTKIDLSPAAFAAENTQISAYINAAVTEELPLDKVTWADVVAKHVTYVDPDAEEKEIESVDPIFTGVGSQDAFIGAILDMITPLEPILSFLLTGGTLSIYAGDTPALTLGGGKGYSEALEPLLVYGLGLHEFGATIANEPADGVEALSNIIDMILDNLLPELKSKPVTTILKVLGNAAYFIANNDVKPVISNLIAPIETLLNDFSDVITRSQLNRLLKSFIGLGLDDIINIGENQGKNLVDFINKYLQITLTDEDGHEVTVGALPDNFFVDLAKVCIDYDDPDNPTNPTTNGTDGDDITKWHVEIDAVLYYVLEKVLSHDFLRIIVDLAKMEEGSTIYDVIMGLDGKTDEVVDILLKLLSKYLVEYKAYNEEALQKAEDPEGKYTLSDSDRIQMNQLLDSIDGLIPAIFGLIPSIDAENLAELVNGIIENADLGSTLVNLIIPILAGLPADTINMIAKYVNELTNFKQLNNGTALDLSPAAFKDNFGSKLKILLNGASTWDDIDHKKYVYTYTAAGEEKTFYGETAGMTTATIDETPYTLTPVMVEVTDDEEHTTSVQKTQFHLYPGEFEWEIDDLTDLGKLICDMLQPFDAILKLILMGGTERAAFIADGTHNGSMLTAFEDINIVGGDGYNYAIVPLLEALGVEAKTQTAYEAAVDAADSSLKPIIDMLFDQVDKILDKPIDTLLSILANLFYMIGEDNLEIVIQNLIAPVNNLIEAIDGLFPLAIQVNLGAMLAGENGVETYIGQAHPGVPAGISIALKGDDIKTLLTNLLAGINLGDSDKHLSITFDWLEIAAMAAADNDNDNYADKIQSKLDPSYDLYPLVDPDDKDTKGSNMWNVVGDKANALMALLKAILTEENIDVIMDLLPDSIPDDIKDKIEDLLNNPKDIIELLIGLFGDPINIPIQNHTLEGALGFDYRAYFTLTKANADVIARDADALINKILTMANVGSLKDLVYTKLATNANINTILDKVIPLLANADSILETVKGIATIVDGDETKPLDLTLAYFNKVYKQEGEDGYRFEKTAAKKAAQKAAQLFGNLTSWADVADAYYADGHNLQGTDWGFRDGDIFGFATALATILSPLNDVLELLLIGNGKSLKLLGIAEIKGSDGYDYAIIPLLEALGISANHVKTLAAYKTYVGNCKSEKLLDEILYRLVNQVDWILGKPVDRLTEILPTFGYFVSNEGFYLAVRNLLSPVFKVVDTVLPIVGIDLGQYLNLSKLLNSFEIGINVLGAKYGFHIPEIDWTKLARQGADGTTEVDTSRSQDANSFVNAKALRKSQMDDYISRYPAEAAAKDDPSVEKRYYGTAQKTTQTKIIADKGDTLTLVLTWLLKMFGEQQNREALVRWLSDVFDLAPGGGAEQAVGYGVNEMFNACDANHVAEIIISSLFSLLGLGIVINEAYDGNVNNVKAILQRIFQALADGPDTCMYSGIADAMESITGVWKETVGTDEEYHEATQEVQQTVENTKQTLNWFQRLIQAIKNFFAKIFRFGR